MAIILDVILVVLAAIFIFDGFKRGAVRSLVDILGYVVVLALASWLSAFVADLVFNSFMKPSLITTVNESLVNTAQQDVNSKAIDLFNSLPGFVSNTLRFYGVSENTLGSAVQLSSENAAEEVVGYLSPIFINLLKTLGFSVLFVSLMTIFKVFSRTLVRIFRLPLLKQVNELLGIVCGALKCAILVLVVCLILRMTIPAMNNVPEILSQDTIDSTIIFKNVYYNNPLYTWVQGLSV